MQALSQPNLQSPQQVRFKSVPASQAIILANKAVSNQLASSSMLTGNTESRMSGLAKALKRILDPSQDRLLAGYAELIQLVKSSTVAAKENRLEEEKAYYEAQIARFSKDRRQAIKKDDNIRDFLTKKKTDIYSVIKNNLDKLKVFPENHSLIDPMSAVEKVAKIQESLKNPHLATLAKYVASRQTDTLIPAHLSPVSRRKMQNERQRFASQDYNLTSSSKVDINFSNLGDSNSQGKLAQLFLDTRQLQLSDLGTLLEDLEVIELETVISQQEYNVPGQNRQDDKSISRNKQTLEMILERPSLSELLQKSIEKTDVHATRMAEKKLNLMHKLSLKNLAGRVNTMVGMNENRSSSVRLHNNNSPGPDAEGNTTWLATSNGDIRESPVTDVNYDSTPSRRALHAFAQLVNQNLRDKTKYVPFRQLMPQSHLHDQEDDSYNYKNIEAILASASSHFKFSRDIDNSEEEELTDDELRERVKTRKNKERDRRDDLKMVKQAAIDTVHKVEATRKCISGASILKGAINLDALKQRQARLRDKMNMGVDNIEEDSRMNSDAKARRELNERSGDLGYSKDRLGHSYSFKNLVQQQGYEPCEEDDADEYSSANSAISRDQDGKSKPKRDLDPVEALEIQMRKYQSASNNQQDTLDKEKLNQYQFKASFISHLCAVKDRQPEYKDRLKTFNRKRSTKGELVNQQYLEKQIYEQMHHQQSSRSAIENTFQQSREHLSVLDPNMTHKRSQSSFTTASGDLQITKRPTYNNTITAAVAETDSHEEQKKQIIGIIDNGSQIRLTPAAQSQPAFLSLNHSQKKQQRLKNLRGPDLTCVNSSVLQISNQISNVNLDQPIIYQNSQQPPFQFDTPPPNNEHTSLGEQLAQNNSHMSLKIVLSPRGLNRDSGSLGLLKDSNNTSQRQYVHKLQMNQKESTVTILGAINENNKLKNHKSNRALKSDVSLEILNHNRNENDSKMQSKKLIKTESEKKMAALYYGTQSRSLLGTQSSASQEQLDQKLGDVTQVSVNYGGGGLTNQLSQQEIENSEMMKTFKEVTSKDNTERQNTQHLVDNTEPQNKQNLVVTKKTTLNESSKASKQSSAVKLIELPQEKFTTVDYEKSAQKIDLQNQYVEKIKINANMMKQINPAPSPQFMISPKIPDINQNMTATLRTQIESMVKHEEDERQVIQMTQFDFPLPKGQETPEQDFDHEQLTENFKEKIMQRFGGLTSSVAGFQNIPKNSSFYQYRQVKEMEMNKTQQHIEVYTANQKEMKSLQSPKLKNKGHKKVFKPSERSVVAHEISVGSSSNFKEILAKRKNKLLRPTEYLQLSSKANSIDSSANRSKTKNSEQMLMEDNKQDKTIKNVVKLQLNERASPPSTSKPSKEMQTLTRSGQKETDPKDDRSDIVDLNESRQRMRPLMQDQNIQSNFQGTPIITASIKVNRKSIDENSQILTQGNASNLHYTDAATTPFQMGTKPTSPNESVSELKNFNAKRKEPQKLQSHLNVGDALDNFDSGHQDFNKRTYKAAQMRKLSISILTNKNKGNNKEARSPTISPTKTLNQASSVIFGSSINESRIPNVNSGTRITPHLQNTNVKIALQKEKSKQMIKILQQQSSRQIGAYQSVTSIDEEEMHLKESQKDGVAMLVPKSSSPFLQPTKIDLGLHLDQQFQKNARATQDYKTMSSTMIREQQNGKNSKMSQRQLGEKSNSSRIHLGQQTTEYATNAAGEYVLDDNGQFIELQQLNRKASQAENPLLDCSEEDENVENTNSFSARIQTKHGYNKHNSGNYYPRLDGGPQQIRLAARNDQKQGYAARNSSVGQTTYDSLAQDSKSNFNYHQIMKTPNAENEKLAMGLGGDDIVTDGASRIMIEQEIREMQGLLPPLLETASTKQFFKNDEIRLEGDDQRRQDAKGKRNKEESVPLQYIRDLSKLSDINSKQLIKEKPGRQSRQRLFQLQKFGSAAQSPLGTQMQTTGIHYSPTPLSVLKESQNKSIGVGTKSVLRQSHPQSSGVSISINKKHQKGARKSEVVGPYLKSFTQRIKLPNLNRSHYNGFNTQQDTIHDKRRLYESVDTHKRVSNAGSSIVTKQNNVFTTQDGEIGGGIKNVQKHMANNFRVQIKNNLHTSMDQFNKTQFIDLHSSARNSIGFGMQVHSLRDKTNNLDPPVRLQSQILVYGGEGDFSSAGASKFQNHRNRQVMHQTLTQVQMPPIDVSALKTYRKLPPKSLLFKGKAQGGSNLNRLGSKGRASPKLSENDSGVNIVNQKQQLQILMSKNAEAASLSKNLIVSGQTELAPQKKVRLAQEFCDNLVPISLPLMENKIRVSIAETDAIDDQENVVQAQSLQKATQDASIQNDIIMAAAGQIQEIRYNSAEALPGFINQDGMTRNQQSHETLRINKEISVVNKQIPQYQDSPTMKPDQIDRIMERIEQKMQPQQQQYPQVVEVPQMYEHFQSSYVSMDENSTSQHHHHHENLENIHRYPLTIDEPQFNQILLSIASNDYEQQRDAGTQHIQEKNDSSTVNPNPPIISKEQELFQQHEIDMFEYKKQQTEQAENERLYTKQPISYSGQNDISNSVWIDTEKYAQKKMPELLLKDLKEQTRNGKIESGKSPFNEQDFLRMDGQTVKLMQQTDSSQLSKIKR